MPINGSSSETPDKEYDEFEQNKEDQFTVSMNQDDWQGFQNWKRSKAKAQAGYIHETDRRINAEECQEMIAKAVKFPLVKMETEKPMFFETEHGNLIHIDYIIAFVPKDGFLNIKDAIGAKLSENDIERFKRFAKIHGVFGKEM